MKKIIAIGGGEIGGQDKPVETTRIDQEILALTGKKHPSLCFLPTASSDSEGYIKNVEEHFGNTLGCNITSLTLHTQCYTVGELENIILNSDIVYVGGGNTQHMLDKWGDCGLLPVLAEAYRAGIVLSGLSAGAICWFRYGCSDSMRFNNSKAPLISMEALNYQKLTVCPHFDSEKDRKPAFKRILKEKGIPGLGIDNCAALKIVDDSVEIITSKETASVRLCYWQNGEYQEISLKAGFVEKIDYFLNPPMNHL